MNTAIVLAAGKGKRMNEEINKQFLMLLDKPIIVHTLQAFHSCDKIDEIILVTAPDEIEYFKSEILCRYNLGKVKKLVGGGAERQQSAYNGIMAVSQDSDIVLLHDGARPFVTHQIIIDCINGAKQFGAASAGMPCKDTIKLVNEQNLVQSTPPRQMLWITQTPQCFKKELIIEAHKAAIEKRIIATDDAGLVELLGSNVLMVRAAYENIKITTPEDLPLAEAFATKIDLDLQKLT